MTSKEVESLLGLSELTKCIKSLTQGGMAVLL